MLLAHPPTLLPLGCTFTPIIHPRIPKIPPPPQWASLNEKFAKQPFTRLAALATLLCFVGYVFISPYAPGSPDLLRLDVMKQVCRLLVRPSLVLTPHRATHPSLFYLNLQPPPPPCTYVKQHRSEV